MFIKKVMLLHNCILFWKEKSKSSLTAVEWLNLARKRSSAWKRLLWATLSKLVSYLTYTLWIYTQRWYLKLNYASSFLLSFEVSIWVCESTNLSSCKNVFKIMWRFNYGEGVYTFLLFWIFWALQIILDKSVTNRILGFKKGNTHEKDRH